MNATIIIGDDKTKVDEGVLQDILFYAREMSCKEPSKEMVDVIDKIAKELNLDIN